MNEKLGAEGSLLGDVLSDPDFVAQPKLQKVVQSPLAALFARAGRPSSDRADALLHSMARMAGVEPAVFTAEFSKAGPLALAIDRVFDLGLLPSGERRSAGRPEDPLKDALISAEVSRLQDRGYSFAQATKLAAKSLYRQGIHNGFKTPGCLTPHSVARACKRNERRGQDHLLSTIGQIPPK